MKFLKLSIGCLIIGVFYIIGKGYMPDKPKTTHKPFFSKTIDNILGELAKDGKLNEQFSEMIINQDKIGQIKDIIDHGDLNDPIICGEEIMIETKEATTSVKANQEIFFRIDNGAKIQINNTEAIITKKFKTPDPNWKILREKFLVFGNNIKCGDNVKFSMQKLNMQTEKWSSKQSFEGILGEATTFPKAASIALVGSVIGDKIYVISGKDNLRLNHLNQKTKLNFPIDRLNVIAIALE